MEIWKFGDTILNFHPTFHISPRKIRMRPPDSGVLPDSKIVEALLAQLGWTHFSFFIYLDNPFKRDPKDGKVGLIGYEINFNRCFYRYTPPRPLEEIESDIRAIEADIVRMLADITGSGAYGV